MYIRNSVDWAPTETALRSRINSKVENSSNRSQLLRMIDNIGIEVTSLSKAEVLARRGSKANAEYLLEKINNDINEVNEFILVAALLG